MRRGLYGLGALFLVAVGVGGFAGSQLQAVQAAQDATRAEVFLNLEPLGSMVQAAAAVGRQSEEDAFPTSRTLNVATGRNNQIDSIPTGQGAVTSLIELNNGDLISGGGGSLRRWRDGKPLGAAIPTGQGGVNSLIALQNGELISGGFDGSLRRWRDGKPLGAAIPTGQGPVWSLIALNNGDLISGGGASLRRWRDGKPLGAAIPTGQGMVMSLIALNNGELISGGGAGDGSLRRWRDGKPLGAAIPTGQGPVWSLIALNNGELISGGGAGDGSLRRWRDGQAVGAAITTGQRPVVSGAILVSKHKVITNASGKIVGINNLRIGDKQYNVRFDSGLFEELYVDSRLNPPFKIWPFPRFEESDEPMKAENAINAVLNSLEKVPQSVGEDLQPPGWMTPLIVNASVFGINHSYCIPLEYSIIERTYGKAKSDPETSLRTLCSSYNHPKSLIWDVNMHSGAPAVPNVYAQFSLLE